MCTYLPAVRSNTGVELRTGPPSYRGDFLPDPTFPKEESKLCRAIEYSNDGRFLAWTNGVTVQVCRTSDRQILVSLPRPKAFYIKFSPKATYLMTWEICVQSKENPTGQPNLFIYKTQTGEELYSVIQKRQTDWQPYWSADETLVAQMIAGEVQFMEVKAGGNGEGLGKITKRLGGGRNGSISMAPNGGKPFLAFYTPGTKAAPSICKIYQSDATTVVTTKSFFQADRVEMFWNKKGTGLLLLTSTEVDKQNNSYYGKQALHFMSTRGDSYSVTLGKDGPIHSVAWSPKSTEFCVIYGFMPAKATVFNLKCDPVHQFEEAARNSIYYNPFGNILMLAGFGNLRGPVEIYEVGGKQKKLIANIMAPDTTLLEWHPDGEHFVCATTAPRLRMSNGFKIWHYSGSLLHETVWPTGEELLEVAFQKCPGDAYKEPVVSAVKVEGIASSVPQASAQIYRPPCARGVPLQLPAYVAPPKKTKKPNQKKGGPEGTPGTPGNGQAGEEKGNGNNNNNRTPQQKRNNNNGGGNKKNVNGTPRTNGANTNGQEAAENGVGTPVMTSTTPLNHAAEEFTLGNNTTPTTTQEGGYQRPPQMTPRPPFDVEKAKRKKLIKKKLQDIQKLREKQTAGEKLDHSQTAKLDSEQKLIQELADLKIIRT